MTGSIIGTMVASGAGIQPATLRQIDTRAWVLTLPAATIALSAGLLRVLS